MARPIRKRWTRHTWGGLEWGGPNTKDIFSSSSRFDSHLFLWSDNFCIRRPTGRRRIRAVWNRKCLCIRISYYSSIWRYCTRIRIWRRIREKETKDVTSASWLTPDNKKGELWQKPQSTTSVFSTYFRLFSTSLEKREREKEKSQQRDIYIGRNKHPHLLLPYGKIVSRSNAVSVDRPVFIFPLSWGKNITPLVYTRHFFLANPIKVFTWFREWPRPFQVPYNNNPIVLRQHTKIGLNIIHQDLQIVFEKHTKRPNNKFEYSSHFGP